MNIHLQNNNQRTNIDDEYYTQMKTIENYMFAYKEWLYDKYVYLNCDNSNSNFLKFFKQHFHDFGLRRLVATSIDHTVYDSLYDNERVLVDGSYRSPYCKKYVDACDVIITNPPFSKMVDFIDFLLENNKKFIIIGSKLTSGYKNFFAYWKNNYVHNVKTKPSFFIRPDGSLADIGCYWYSNIDIGLPKKQIIENTDKSEFEKVDEIDNCYFVKKMREFPIDADCVCVPMTINEYNIKGWKIHGIVKPKINGEQKFGRILMTRT